VLLNCRNIFLCGVCFLNCVLVLIVLLRAFDYLSKILISLLIVAVRHRKLQILLILIIIVGRGHDTWIWIVWPQLREVDVEMWIKNTVLTLRGVH